MKEHYKRIMQDIRDVHPDILEAYKYVESVRGAAERRSDTSYGWYGWSMREAFLAGISFVQEKKEKTDDMDTSQKVSRTIDVKTAQQAGRTILTDESGRKYTLYGAYNRNRQYLT